MKSLIQTPTNKLESSLEFYKKLDFKVISEDPMIVSDGKAFIQINPNRYARAGLRLLGEDWGKSVAKLKTLTEVMETEEGYLLAESSGMWIYLIETDASLDNEVSEKSFSALGNYAGIGLETPGVERSEEILTVLGFTKDDSGWPSFTNGDNMTITLYKPNSCPHLFFNPSLTYFNGGRNPEVIEYIRKQNIPITEEITYFNPNNEVDNVIIRDPGGFGFFIFND